jgi:hypothetical protein
MWNGNTTEGAAARGARIGLVALMLGLACGCGGKAPEAAAGSGPGWFEDASSRVGLDFVHDAGPTGNYFMPQIMGSGAALFDFDDDGLLDIYLLNNAGPESSSTNRLYHQEPGGHFRDVSRGSGLDVAGYGMGAAAGDIDNDGRVDLLLTEYGRVRLFLNSGGSRFVDVSSECGFDQSSWGTSAGFFDYDRDGWLDLVVAGYVEYERTVPCSDQAGARDYCSPGTFRGSVTRLYHNLGKDSAGNAHRPRFEDVTAPSGLVRATGPGLGVYCADFDGDRWPDIFVANDGRPNHLWINQHDGTFTEEGVLRGISVNSLGAAEGNMGVAVGDIDGDGSFDVFVTHLTQETPTLWQQGPRGQFLDRTGQHGLATPRWRGTGFGTVLADLDNDGDLDLAIVNGGVKRNAQAPRAAIGTATSFWKNYSQRNQLFSCDEDRVFRDMSENNAAFCATPGVSRGLCAGDFDNDGAVDLLVTVIAGPARLYRNVARRSGHWLTVRTIDPQLRRDAYGAEVTVCTGSVRRSCGINPAASYLCSHDPRAHFGLGSADQYSEILVVWPDGVEELFPGGNVDRLIVLKKGEGSPVETAEESHCR